MASAILLTSCLLFSASTFAPPVLPGEDVRFPGGLATRVMTEWPEVHGHFDLWRGQWWRLLVSAFHHVNFLHLAGNAITLWLLADLLEPRLGRVRFLIFSLAGAMFSFVPEVLMDNDCVGLSGLVFAMFGLLLVMRQCDEELVARMPDRFIVWGFAWLFLCIPLTTLAIVPIANAAHCFGLVYGYTVGKVCFNESARARRFAPFLLVVVNAVPLGLLVAAMHPFWEGRYFAWRGFQHDQAADWRRAAELDPSIGVAWMRLMEMDIENGDPAAAWERGLIAIRLNRSNQKLQQSVVAVWSQFTTAKSRESARQAVRRVFGDESDAWLVRLGLKISTTKTDTISGFEFFNLPPQSAPRLDQIIELPEQLAGVTEPFPQTQTIGEVDPDAPDSAMLGEAL